MRRRHIAEHEATHAIVAMKMGLPVVWATIDHGHDEGIDFIAAVKISDEGIDPERDKLAICVAMAAPTFIETHREVAPELYAAARFEAGMAFEIGGRAGITFDEIYDLASSMVDDHWPEICDLTERLMEEGRVVFQTA
jgi:hypothetical protein